MNILQKIKTLAKDFSVEMIAVRCQIHTNPELGFEEFDTAKLIAEKLDEYRIPYQSGIAKTGIVGLIKGKNPDKRTIALRADMDALQIIEKNNCEYKSLKDGIMHACGHDAHIACLLGASKILSQLKDEFEGSIKLIFQPSEEKFPGGAKAMINDGVLFNPNTELIIGQHVLPTLDCGKMGLKSGKYMASTDEIYLTIKGKGGHAATPELNIDAIVIASQIIIALQQITSRYARPNIPTVLSFGKIIGNGRTNVIPDEVFIEGTFRTFDEDWREEAHSRISKIAKSIAEGMGASCDVVIYKGYPYLVNDKNLTDLVKQKAIEYMGAENVVDLDMRMTAEDFAYFSQEKPSCFYRLGTRNESKGIISNLHTSTFDIDENSIEIGMGLMAWLAMSQLPPSVRDRQ